MNPKKFSVATHEKVLKIILEDVEAQKVFLRTELKKHCGNPEIRKLSDHLQIQLNEIMEFIKNVLRPD